MSLINRPYIGSWSLEGKALVQHTPDALVYINGDTSLPSCSKCSGRIDIQRFLTECSVDAGTDIGSSSASFTLSIPIHHTQAFARDANYILRPGLEVEVYFRGYFPVSGLYGHLAQPYSPPTPDLESLEEEDDHDHEEEVQSPVRDFGEGFSVDNVPQELLDKWAGKRGFTNFEDIKDPRLQTNIIGAYASAEVIEQYWKQRFPDAEVFIGSHIRNNPDINPLRSNHGSGSSIDFFIRYDNGTKVVPALQTWGSTRKMMGNVLPNGGSGVYVQGGNFKNSAQGAGFDEQGVAGGNGNTPPGGSSFPHYDHRGHLEFQRERGGLWFRIRTTAGGSSDFSTDSRTTGDPYKYLNDLADSTGNDGYRDIAAYVRANGTWQEDSNLPEIGPEVSTWNEVLGINGEPSFTQASDQVVRTEANATLPQEAQPSFLEDLGLGGQGIENTLDYPYYRVFHGVVTGVSFDESGGVQTVSVTCSSMLHFWQYQNMSTNASVLGAKPTNSKNKMSMVGHNFTGMHPYEIIYTLFHDTAGAAGGVDYVLKSKSNLTAKSTVGGESLFSLTQRYWEERFKGRVNKLRLHGARGDLFSTMAAAWLSRTSSSRLMSAIKKRYSDRVPDGTKKVLSQATTVGLYNKNRKDAINSVNFASRSRGADDANTPKFEINLLEMQAFVSNIGNWGQVNLFESSYESKADIVGTVCEVTGFEFYQDVDGDFVFKPPMYNLDTSSSRVYRIEDIDIIQISHSESEPQATYMTVKGGHFKNLHGVGLENEWGVQGKFIDYPLVAQYGWRPGTFETSYFNDPKSMFFAAVNRMDILNIGIHSASVTIPIRPEMRAGYPVYIPYLDCYYYCNSFSHSYSVGGQCSTSLQLVGRRNKFFAPGKPNRDTQRSSSRSGIEDIDLGDTLLPKRPLEVIGEDGIPKLSGFPNVVMALDPQAINPLFFVVGTEIQNLADPVALGQILDIAEQLQVVKSSTALGEGRVYFMDTVSGDTPVRVNFYVNPTDVSDQGELDHVPIAFGDEGSNPQTSVNVNALAAAVRYQNLVKAQTDQTARARKEVSKSISKIGVLSDRISREEKRKNPRQTKISQWERERDDLEDSIQGKSLQISQKARENEDTWRDPSRGEGVAFLLNMLDQTGQVYKTQADFQGRNDLTNTTNLLDMLADRKAIFSNGTQPGRYRYYSCSHPDPAQQGPKRFKYDGNRVSKVVPTNPETIDPENQSEVLQYTRTPSATSDSKIPEASLVKATPTIGIRVLTSTGSGDGGENIGGEVLPTSDIHELSFSVQLVTSVGNVTSSKAASVSSGLSKDLRASLVDYFSVTAPESTFSPQDLYFIQWTLFVEILESAIDDLFAQKPSDVLIDRPTPPDLPQTLIAWGQGIPVDTVLGTYRYSGNEDAEVILSKAASRATLDEVVSRLTSSMAQYAEQSLSQIASILNQNLQLQSVLGSEREELMSAYYKSLASSFGVKTTRPSRRKRRKKKTKASKTFSPVFPISDAQGYTVVGNYPYGRGVDISPDGVFSQIANVDLFSLLSKDLIDKILRVFVKGQSITTVEYRTETRPDGSTVTVPVEQSGVRGQAARDSLNREALRQLRDQNLTDGQILTRNFASLDPNTGLLEFELSNYFEDETKEGVHKIPVANAARSLADISVTQNSSVCACKAAEADVLLRAFGSSDYVDFGGSTGEQGLGTDPGDAGSRFIQTNMQQAAQTWQVQQQRLRGQQMDRGGSTFLSSVDDALDAFGNTTTAENNAQAALDEQTALAADLLGDS